MGSCEKSRASPRAVSPLLKRDCVVVPSSSRRRYSFASSHIRAKFYRITRVSYPIALSRYTSTPALVYHRLFCSILFVYCFARSRVPPIVLSWSCSVLLTLAPVRVLPIYIQQQLQLGERGVLCVHESTECTQPVGCPLSLSCLQLIVLRRRRFPEAQVTGASSISSSSTTEASGPKA